MHISDLTIAKIQRSLQRYAAPVEGLSEEENALTRGTHVYIYWNKSKRHLIRFVGVTKDSIKWHVDVDFRAYNREYRERMVAQVGDAIREHRKTRSNEPAPQLMLLSDLREEVAAEQIIH